jgi:hypothetical protein
MTAPDWCCYSTLDRPPQPVYFRHVRSRAVRKIGRQFFHSTSIFPSNAVSGSGRTSCAASDATNIATETNATANCLAFAPTYPAPERVKLLSENPLHKAQPRPHRESRPLPTRLRYRLGLPFVAAPFGTVALAPFVHAFLAKRSTPECMIKVLKHGSLGTSMAPFCSCGLYFRGAASSPDLDDRIATPSCRAVSSDARWALGAQWLSHRNERQSWSTRPACQQDLGQPLPKVEAARLHEFVTRVSIRVGSIQPRRLRIPFSISLTGITVAAKGSAAITPGANLSLRPCAVDWTHAA